MACTHVNAPELRPPGTNQSVYREDCTQCFDSIDDPTGLDVCLYCFNGGCTADRSHSVIHVSATNHPLVLNIKRTRKEITRDEPPAKITKLSIAAGTECELNENLWLCLTCGNLGCGRQQFGGVGGNSHGVGHTKSTGHPVAVKLGSLTADGTADIYCYACDEERVDPELPNHLSHWGINIKDRVKTEKSLTEMQVEQNLRWEFSMTTEDGKELKPLFGSDFTGLKNLGNSCYLNSTLQALFAIPEFRDRYYLPEQGPPDAPLPAEDLETQLRKIADGLISGRYSKPDSDVIVSEDTPEVPHQRGLAPAMLKHLIG